MTKIILGLLIVATSLISCESQKEEDVKVSLTYSHEQSRQKSIRSPIVISKHTIDVADYDYKNIYDSTELDQSMTGTVIVPVDVNLEVQYKNYTLEEPKIHYESGISDPFVVTHSSPPTTTVTIPVSVNTDHPSQVVEEEVVDNETILVETQILSWSDNFMRGVKATQQQEQTYKDFWDNASSQTWDNISIGNPDNMTTCTNNTFINDFLRSKDNASFAVSYTHLTLPTICSV